MNLRFLYPIISVLIIFGFGQVLAGEALASQPNIVLSQAIHFSTPEGQPVTVSPGKYFVEQVGARHLRFSAEDGSAVIDVQAQSFTHEQYELFSAMAMTRPGEDDRFYVDLLLPGGVRLEATGSTSPPEGTPPAAPSPPQSLRESPSTSRMLGPSVHNPRSNTPSIKPVWAYLPPKDSNQKVRIDGVQPSKQKGMPDLFVLAPDHIGFTIFEQPTLYWSITQSTDEPIDMMMREEATLRIVFDVRLLPPHTAGIHPINLMDFDMRLTKNVSYQWIATLRLPKLTQKVTASGYILRIDPPESLSHATGQHLMHPEAPKLYAQAGLWYDALGALFERIRSQPQNVSLLQQRSALLQQVGLTEVALLELTP